VSPVPASHHARAHPDYAGIGRALVIAVLVAFALGFGTGAVSYAVLGHGPQPDETITDQAPVEAVAALPPHLVPQPRLLPVAADARAIDTGRPTTAAVMADPVLPAPADAATPPDPLPLDMAMLSDGEHEPLLEPASTAPRIAEHDVKVRRGDTLSTILARRGVGRSESEAVIDVLDDLYDPRRLRTGQRITLALADGDGSDRLARLEIDLAFPRFVEIARGDDGIFRATERERPLVRRPERAAARIDGSLFLAAQRKGVPQAPITDLVRMFSWDVDFQRDVRNGDGFEVVYERVSTVDGSQVRSGPIRYASLELTGERLEAYRFVHADGAAEYYDRTGRSMRKFLLKTPVDGARLSSRFGRRTHPILGYTRMHKGVDFAAPKGTPVYASGDGRVAAIGRDLGYGKHVRIRHNGEFSSTYAHLSRFADGLERGARVRQGQVIGYVGSTGLATGPHLHYEVLKSGRQVNPLKLDMQPARTLAGAELDSFRATIREIDGLRRSLARETQLASNMH
jgi:murein DD-endopeptidase MepM/ murein hydrolase activator NlpD